MQQEVVEWAAGVANITLDNGKAIEVANGDLLLAETDPATGALRFVEILSGRA